MIVSGCKRATAPWRSAAAATSSALPQTQGQRRPRSAVAFKRSDISRAIAQRDVTGSSSTAAVLTGPAKSAITPRAASVGEKRERSTAATPRKHFEPMHQGLGSATLKGSYTKLGAEVQVPPFLKEPKTVSIIGAPMSWGQPRAGTDQGSAILRDSGLEGTLVDLEWRLDDHGDLKFDPPQRGDPSLSKLGLKGNAKNCFTVGKGLKKIHDHVYRAAMEEEFALVLGGDHSVSAGSLSAILRARPETGVIWVDAHGDMNTPDSSPSGNMHGMPLGLLMGLVDPTKLPGFEWFADVPVLRPEQICFVGLRDLDTEERRLIRDLKINAFTMHHVDRWGIGNVMEMAIDSLRLESGELRPLHLSYDIDAVDPELAPSTGTIVRGGLNYREAHYVAEAVSETGMLGSMDLVEVNPKLTPGPESEQTAALGMALISSAMGSRII